MSDSTDEPSAGRGSIAPRHLDELGDITREYARITGPPGTGAWTYLLVGAWIAGGGLLLRASLDWGRLAFLALVPATLAVYLLERRVALPHGAVVGAPSRGRAMLRPVKAFSVGLVVIGEWQALIALYFTSTEVAWLEFPLIAWLVALLVFPAVAAAPVAALFLTGWRVEGVLFAVFPLQIACTVAFLPRAGAATRAAPAVAIGLGCLLVLLSLLWLWMRLARLRMLDRRMAHLRERLR